MQQKIYPEIKHYQVLMADTDKTSEILKRFIWRRNNIVKKTLLTVLISLFSLSVFCGDLATFVDLGFSKDGKKYMFGQYGVTDSEIQGYAEIYIVDVEKNEYVEGGVFRRLPSKETEGKDGKGLFNMLISAADGKAKAMGIDYSDTGKPLFVLADAADEGKNISFRDFEKKRNFEMNLKSSIYGKDSKVLSSFYIDTRIFDEYGNEIFSGKVGNPDYQRKNVSDYEIRRVITNKTGNSVVCIIEKKEYDRNGPSSRFMVETFTIN